MVDAKDRFLEDKDRRAVADPGFPPVIPSHLVEVKNKSGVNLVRFAPARISGVVLDPTAGGVALTQFKDGPAFEINKQTCGEPIVVVQQYLKPDKYGSAVLYGVTPVTVNVIDVDHIAVAPIDDDVTKFKSAPSGVGRILAPLPTGTGEQLLAVMMGPVQKRFQATANEAITAGGSGKVTIYLGGSASDMDDETAYLDWMHNDEDIESGQELIVEWFDDRCELVIVDAECNASAS